MKLTKDDILKMADLSRIDLNEEEVTKITRQVSDILGYIEILENAVSGVRNREIKRSCRTAVAQLYRTTYPIIQIFGADFQGPLIDVDITDQGCCVAGS